MSKGFASPLIHLPCIHAGEDIGCDKCSSLWGFPAEVFLRLGLILIPFFSKNGTCGCNIYNNGHNILRLFGGWPIFFFFIFATGEMGQDY